MLNISHTKKSISLISHSGEELCSLVAPPGGWAIQNVGDAKSAVAEEIDVPVCEQRLNRDGQKHLNVWGT